MTKQYFTMVNTIIFEVDEELLSEVSNAKEAFEKGAASITEHEVTLINPDGTIHDNEFDKIAIKQAINYGLQEKG